MFNLPFFSIRKDIKPNVLLIMDGFGVAPASPGNAISLAKTPNYKRLFQMYPHTELIASGESVGLPANEVGNTEVGHLTIGAGRTILQDLKKINLCIENGSFYNNRSLVMAANHIKTNGSKFHVIGLVSSGNVHSSINHLYAIIQFCKKESIKDVYLHIFTDGRDAPPKEGVLMIEKLENYLKTINLGKIASVTGRYYAMDRDRRWERTEKTYKALTMGIAIQTQNSLDAVNAAYARGQTDEFIEPTVIVDGNGPIGKIDDNDAVIFFNYRIDRAKQLSMALCMSDFENLKKFDFGKDEISEKIEENNEAGEKFKREKIVKNLFFATMTEYHKNLPVSGVLYGPEPVRTPIARIISEAGFKQVHMAESEKERFVTYYFNGLKEEPFSGEDRIIIPSPKVATYDKKPEMSLPKLTGEFNRQVRSGKYHFAVINFANPDMVAHTGNLEASVEAVEYIDRYLQELVKAVLGLDGTVFVTADHGNCEELITYPSTSFFITTNKGIVNTDHSNNPVPFLIIGSRYQGKSVDLVKGSLADVAPTILNSMELAVPEEMTGKNLLALGR